MPTRTRALAEINAVFHRFGRRGIARRDPGAPLGLDNIRGEPGPPAPGGALVTVILPLWNAAASIKTALVSLAEQSWENLEVLVVDDASTDAGPDLVADFARQDPRFRLIRQAENQGAYAARNRGAGRGDAANLSPRRMPTTGRIPNGSRCTRPI